MADPRIEQLADILVGHSLKVSKGEKILISASVEAAPLVKEVYRKVLRAGGHPLTQLELPGLARIFYDEAGEEQLAYNEHTLMTYEHVDGMIRILAESNTKELTGVTAEKLRLRQKATRPATEILLEDRTRWVLTRFPTNALAQDADMSLEDYEQFVYGATNVDYTEIRNRMLAAAERFDRGSKVRIVGKETDITIDIEGRKGVLCAGEQNVPDGEFFYTPNHRLTEGTIYYDWATSYKSQEVKGIRLTFKEGKVVEFSAEKGEAVLRQALDTDEGARYLGELGIGANFGITRPSKDILFDEKIGGSIHLALGASYAQAGKGNHSAIHWDMVKGLMDGGEIYIDGELVQKNGQWTF
ncbi:aminopeptidase [Paenibacillus turpanensis]|uniref:aminopeptidase n=1 Tax=Paenibacillus turpanensis TaxID=2689078 RepID=UPI001407931E|nr:aminopeptidase [Paenibacillus turpanensis]